MAEQKIRKLTKEKQYLSDELQSAGEGGGMGSQALMDEFTNLQSEYKKLALAHKQLMQSGVRMSDEPSANSQQFVVPTAGSSSKR